MRCHFAYYVDEKLHEVPNDTCLCMPRSPLKCGSSHEMLQQNQLPWEVQASPLKITAECKDRWRIGCCFHAFVSPKTMQKSFPLQDHQSTLQMVWIRELGNRENLEIGSVRCTSLALASLLPDSQCDVSMATAGLYCRRYHDVNNWWLYTTCIYLC